KRLLAHRPREDRPSEGRPRMTAVASQAGTFLPTADHHHLLRAALCDREESVLEALDRWSWTLDQASVRMLPQLYRNLRALEIDHPRLDLLKRFYRSAWSRTELIIGAAREAFAVLNEERIPFILLKGAALLATVCSDHAVRPMQD